MTIRTVSRLLVNTDLDFRLKQRGIANV